MWRITSRRSPIRPTIGLAMFDRRTTPILALVAAGALWGLTVPLSKLGLEWLGAGWLTVVRFGLAAPLLALVARRHLRCALTPAIVASGAAGYGVVILLQNAGIERTSVGHAALIVGAVPVLVAILSAAAGSGTAGPAAWLGALVALGGVGLVAGAGGAGRSLAGDALVLGSVAGSAAFIVIQPRLLAGRDAAGVTAVQLGAAALVSLPVALVAEGAPAAPTAPAPVAAVAALALLGTLVAFWLFTWAQTQVPAELAGAFVNLEPLVGSLAGTIAFGEAFGPAQAAGGAAILGGIALGAVASTLSSDAESARTMGAGRDHDPQPGRARAAGRHRQLVRAPAGQALRRRARGQRDGLQPRDPLRQPQDARGAARRPPR
jgi:O-acetylserine/cysteine efflux transporter